LLSIITYFSSSSALPPSDSTVLLTLENKTHYVAKIRNVVTNQSKPSGRRQDNIDDDDNAYTFGTDDSYEYYPSEDKPVVTGFQDTWTKYPGALIRISVGPAGVWGANRKNQVFKKIPGGWKFMSVSLKDISVGKTSLWGVDKHNLIHKKSGYDGWQHVAGQLIQVSVSGVDDNVVWGCNSRYHVYRRRGSAWEKINGQLKMVSAGESGVWGVNQNHNIFYRTGTFGGGATAGTGWQKVPGGLEWISSGLAGQVWGVNDPGEIFKREGITKSNPVGTAWTKIGIGHLKQIDVFGAQVWGVNSKDEIYRLRIKFNV